MLNSNKGLFNDSKPKERIEKLILYGDTLNNYLESLCLNENYQECYICVDKFQAVVDSQNVPFHSITIKFDYNLNNVSSNENILPNVISPNNSKILDTFITTTIQAVVGGVHALYNIENQNQTWIKINKHILNNIKLYFYSSSDLVDLNLINQANIISRLHLKIKFV